MVKELFLCTADLLLEAKVPCAVTGTWWACTDIFIKGLREFCKGAASSPRPLPAPGGNSCGTAADRCFPKQHVLGR